MGLFINCCCCFIILTIVQLVPASVGGSASGSHTSTSDNTINNVGSKSNNINRFSLEAVDDDERVRRSNDVGVGNSKAQRHKTIHSDQYCTLHLPTSKYLPHFIERYQDSYRYISMHNGTIHIKRGQLLLATCYGNQFKLFPAKMLEIYCPELAEAAHTDTIVLHRGVKIDHSTITPQEALLCQSSVIGSYAAEVDCCHQQGVSSGFFSTTNTNQSSSKNFVRLVDYCLNTHTQNVNFVKYLLTTRDVRVDEQLKYNLNPFDYFINTTRLETHSNTFDHLLSQNRFFDKVRESFGGVAFGDEFIKTSLVPKQFFFSQFQSVSNEPLASAVQWAALNHGNWRACLNDLTSLAQQRMALVHAGTSGKLFLSDYSGKLRQVNIKSELFSSHVVTIPFYFWMVVQTGAGTLKDDVVLDERSFNESVAIVFINNPYLKNIDIQKSIFCEDSCNKVPWLDQLLRKKDIPTLGTTFCCKVHEAAKFIPEIPTCCSKRETEVPTSTKFHSDFNPVTKSSPNEIAPPSHFRPLSEESKDYVRALYESLGKHPFEHFLNQFSRRNTDEDSNFPNSYGKKPDDQENKVQRDLTSLYGRAPVEVHSLPYEFSDRRFKSF